MITRYLKPGEVPFELERACRFLKIKVTSDRFEMMCRMVENLYEEYKATLEPRYRYKIIQVSPGQSGTFTVLLGEGVSFTGKGIHRLLTHSRYAAIFIITLGEKIDTRMAELSKEDFTESYFLDGVASAMTHGVQKILEAELRREAEKLHCQLGRRFAPGYAKWDLAEQKKIFDLLSAEEIEMSLSETYFMLPQKSISGVYGLQPQR